MMMEELRDMLCEELQKITKKGELSAGSLDIVDKLTHSIKSIDTIMAMEGSSYENRRGMGGNSREDRGGSYNYGYERGGSYARRRDAMGRYSRDEAKMELVDELRNLESGMQDEESKRMIRSWIQQVER